MKKNEIMFFEKYMEWGIIILSRIKQTQKVKDFIFFSFVES